MSWPSILFLSIVAITCLVVCLWIQTLYQAHGQRGCSLCRASGQCQPGGENECCCRATDRDGCYHGIGLCQENLTCVVDLTSTGTCQKIDSPDTITPDMLSIKTCQTSNYQNCTADNFGDCCCPQEATSNTQKPACSPSLTCHQDSYRFLSKAGVCVPHDLHLPPS